MKLIFCNKYNIQHLRKSYFEENEPLFQTEAHLQLKIIDLKLIDVYLVQN